MTTDFDSALNDAMESIKGVFGEVISYKPNLGTAFDIVGIFDANHVVIDNSGEVPQESVKPVVGIAWLDLRAAGRPSPKRRDEVTIRGIKYSIAEVMDDGHAEVRLVLTKGASRA